MRTASITLPTTSLFEEPQVHLPKRERTLRQLLRAAIRVFAERGVEGASIQDIAAAAGMANGTFYNYFAAKEDIVQAITRWLAESFSERIARSCAGIEDGAERIAIGSRRYILLAAESPGWALLLLDIVAVAPHTLDKADRYVAADLDLGIRQNRLSVPNRRAALDLVKGTVMLGMKSVATGGAGKAYASHIAVLVLRGLGVPAESAAEVIRRRLPPLPGGTLNLPDLPITPRFQNGAA